MPQFDLLTTVITIVGVMVVVLTIVAYLVLLERKLSAYMQDRIGPNRTGPFGLLQPLVDGAKIFIKEDIVPGHVDRLFYFLAPAIAAGTALLAIAVVPFGSTAAPPGPVAVRPGESVEQAEAEYRAKQEEYRSQHSFVIAPGLDIGTLYVFSIGSLAVYGIILGGWSANNKYSLLGALRSSAQIISYEIPLGMSVLGVVLLNGSLNIERIIDYQQHHGWNVLYQPLAFLLFMTAVFAECNRLPFDLPEAEQELVGGYHTEYSSMKFGLFFLGEYAHMVTTSLLMATLFLGGWAFPFVGDVGGPLGVALKFVVMAFWLAAFIVFFMLVRWTIPRFRYDQLMGMAWQVLIPLSIVNLICVMVVKEFGGSPWLLTLLSAGLFVGTALFAARPTANVVSRPKPAVGGV
jgi:NADH-quinone oxidoreductase subunit H